MMNPLPVILLLAATAVFAVIFHNPTCVHRVVRTLVYYKRDKAAAKALRAMRYTDIRKPR